jgi:hypothetical protein
MAKRGVHKPKRRYYFYLNPYRDAEAVERVVVFKDVLNVKMVGGWVRDPKAERPQQ